MPSGKIAVIDLVEIQLEDLILGIAARDLAGEDDLDAPCASRCVGSAHWA